MDSTTDHGYALLQRQKRRRPLRSLILRVEDILLSPVTAAACVLLKKIRQAGVRDFPVSLALFERIGVFPIRDHYYEPLFAYREPLPEKRDLPGIDFNIAAQLELLRKFNYRDELLRIPMDAPTNECPFYYRNESYASGDADFLYCMVRHLRPRRFYEIGSGNSTLLVRQALAMNAKEAPGHSCEHVCIEPYEQPWLEKAGLRVIRERVERVDPAFFAQLGPGDILFIDSSHMIRPGGDVLYLFQTIVPGLAPGVSVHIHDVFTPRHYPDIWRLKDKWFWNEQYILEAFLAFNRSFRIVAALNLLSCEHHDALAAALPVYGMDKQSVSPRAFWIERLPD